MRWFMKLYQAILLCIYSKWQLAQKALDELTFDMQSNSSLNNEMTDRWTTYLKAMIAQGTGDFDAAARLYRSPVLLSPSSASSHTPKLLGTASYDLSILSRLNLLFLLRDPDMPSLEASNILSDLESRLLPLDHPSSALHVALDLNRALNTPSSAILAKKKPLQNALMASSKGMQNDQLACMAMGAMVHLFFQEMLSGDGQAAKSRQTLLKLATRLESPVWAALSHGLLLQGEVLTSDEDKAKSWREVSRWVGEMRNEGVKGEF
jgi:Cohesin loading factor